MTLVVEDGTGNSAANAYIDVAFGDAYFLLRGNQEWADADTDAKEAAIARATFSLDQYCLNRWIGTRATKAQALAWPRTGAVDGDGFDIDTDEIPAAVKNATAEIALIELSGDENFIQRSVDGDSAVSSVKVGPISTTFAANAPMVKTWPFIDMILADLANTAGIRIVASVGLTDREKGIATNPFEDPEFFDFQQG